uniref:Uncharacterized protein n=1 Tax=Chromera velia CCMP2878 TaxID=1169474 RepID=A0A0G4H1R3_9ALVE|eukprot:Cvel_5562.t1-p1 / transcript=Cvel_5562.t1 / gene=Cvel_5562 / organism=Chromera_velia_CCMP2878 / gene_product=hypothetical protein / transcript_product=hypothetical protein / location=Cvel_scaffold261:46040-46714(+) / protein_length=225 / sequence_SO=supercontig / SO=protein_coding / is_pseudo=false
MLTDKCLGLSFGLLWVGGILLITLVENTDVGLYVVLFYIILTNGILALFIALYFRKVWKAYVSSKELHPHPAEPVRSKYQNAKKGPQTDNQADPNMSYATELEKIVTFKEEPIEKRKGREGTKDAGAEGDNVSKLMASRSDAERQELMGERERRAYGDSETHPDLMPFASLHVPWPKGMESQRGPRDSLGGEADGDGDGDGEGDGAGGDGDGGDGDGGDDGGLDV